MAQPQTLRVSARPPPRSGSTLKLDNPAAFKGSVAFTGGEVILAGLRQATDYDLTGGVLTIYGGPGGTAPAALRFADNSPRKSGLALTGTDTFLVDARGAAADTWSTVAKFHSGDAATLRGVSAATPQQWADGQGAAGATGLTLHAGAGGGPTASITLAGFTRADLASGKVSAAFGHDAASGSDYLCLHAS